ncbi:hypothetical protein [Vibrio sp. WXL103]|uniref:hypothetical protein n=1 Tax=Vibrio sp. WXL103 TaxID=3450710 RepID=UPI003EC938C2
MMETFNLTHLNQSEMSNFINDKLNHWDNDIMLNLSDEVTLHIPSDHQNKLVNHVESEVVFSIHPEFVSVVDNDDCFNAVDAQLIGLQERNSAKYQVFRIGNTKVVCRSKSPVDKGDIGRLYKLSFDTFFGHIYDRETEENLTI